MVGQRGSTILLTCAGILLVRSGAECLSLFIFDAWDTGVPSLSPCLHAGLLFASLSAPFGIFFLVGEVSSLPPHFVTIGIIPCSTQDLFLHTDHIAKSSGCGLLQFHHVPRGVPFDVFVPSGPPTTVGPHFLVTSNLPVFPVFPALCLTSNSYLAAIYQRVAALCSLISSLSSDCTSDSPPHPHRQFAAYPFTG